MARIEVEDLHAETVLSHLKAGHRSGGVLEEHVDSDVTRLHARSVTGLELPTTLDDPHDVITGHVFDRQKVTSGVVGVELFNNLSAHREATFES